MADTTTRHAFSLDEWHRMSALSDEDARVELVKGDVLEMAPIGDRHALLPRTPGPAGTAQKSCSGEPEVGIEPTT